MALVVGKDVQKIPDYTEWLETMINISFEKKFDKQIANIFGHFFKMKNFG